MVVLGAAMGAETHTTQIILTTASRKIKPLSIPKTRGIFLSRRGGGRVGRGARGGASASNSALVPRRLVRGMEAGEISSSPSIPRGRGRGRGRGAPPGGGAAAERGRWGPTGGGAAAERGRGAPTGGAAQAGSKGETRDDSVDDVEGDDVDDEDNDDDDEQDDDNIPGHQRYSITHPSSSSIPILFFSYVLSLSLTWPV